MRYFKQILSLFFLLICSTAHAESTESVLEGLLNSTHTLQARFTQTILDERGKVAQRSYGRMALERPGKFRWEVTKPIPQLIVANASRLWVYDPDLQQVTVRTLTASAGDTPALLLSHTQVLEKNFIVKPLQRGTTGWQWFSLVPKRSDKQMFAAIQLGFLNGQIKEMRLQDQLGHLTIIQLEAVKINTPLPPALFVFKPPAGTDIIHEK